MTTFTLQDLNTATPEEDEAFKALEQALENRKIFDNIQPATKEEFMEQALQQHEQNHATIQGATGAQYTPIDMTQFHKPLEEIQGSNLEMQNLFITLTSTIQAIVKLSVEQHKQQAQPVSEGLEETVDVVLQNADWFANKVDEKLDELVDDHDFDYEIERAVENHFGDFCLEDHVDVSSEIESIVDNRLDDMVQEKVEEILREKLSTATITFN